MRCKTVGEMIQVAEAGARKIWAKDSGYFGRKVSVTEDGRSVYELANARSAYRVITGDAPDCDCWFFTNHRFLFGDAATCKHIVSAQWHETPKCLCERCDAVIPPFKAEQARSTVRIQTGADSYIEDIFICETCRETFDEAQYNLPDSYYA